MGIVSARERGQSKVREKERGQSKGGFRNTKCKFKDGCSQKHFIWHNNMHPQRGNTRQASARRRQAQVEA